MKKMGQGVRERGKRGGASGRGRGSGETGGGRERERGVVCFSYPPLPTAVT